MKLRLVILLIASGGVLFAAPPVWWPNSGTQQPAAQNYAPANVGQLKNMAKAAKTHLDSKLVGGSGGGVATVVNSFAPDNGVSYTAAEYEENYRPVNLGQLKAVAKPFYDRLLAVRFDTKANLIAHGYPSTWAFNYPWDSSTAAAANYAPANIGQIKAVFSFDLTNFDTNANGIADSWEIEHGLSIANNDVNNNGIPDASDDMDGDGVSNYQEFMDGTDPFSPGSAVSPPTQVADATNQTQLVVWTLLN